MGEMERKIRQKLDTTFSPGSYVLENESHKHGFSRGPEGHFKLLVVSDEFHALSLVQRHQKLYALLQDEMAAGVHALAIRALTKAESEKSGEFQSPECQHRR